MTKKLLKAAFLLGTLCASISAIAQNPSLSMDYTLPTVAGPVLRPQNASSSTMQNIIGPSGSIEHLYIHSWDVFSSYDNNGIAWRRINASGSLINEDYIVVNYASDIDAVIYEDGGTYFVLAAYYYDDGDPTLKGHYYDIYKWDVSGLLPVSTMNYLSSSPIFGRINVDATISGLAITWCEPGTGIFVKAGSLPGASFGNTVLLPGTTNNVDPDICIRRGGGGSGTGVDLQIAFLDNSLSSMEEYRVPYADYLEDYLRGIRSSIVVLQHLEHIALRV